MATPQIFLSNNEKKYNVKSYETFAICSVFHQACLWCFNELLCRTTHQPYHLNLDWVTCGGEKNPHGLWFMHSILWCGLSEAQAIFRCVLMRTANNKGGEKCEFNTYKHLLHTHRAIKQCISAFMSEQRFALRDLARANNVLTSKVIQV